MLQIRSSLDVADNTGAKVAWAIGVLGRNQRYARVGDVIAPADNPRRSGLPRPANQHHVIRSRCPENLHLALPERFSVDEQQSLVATQTPGIPSRQHDTEQRVFRRFHRQTGPRPRSSTACFIRDPSAGSRR